MIFHDIQEPPLLCGASDLAAALTRSYGVRRKSKTGIKAEAEKMVLQKPIRQDHFFALKA